VSRRREDTPEDTVDKAVGQVAETAGSLTGDDTLEVEGRALGRKAKRKTFRVLAQPEGDGSWKPGRLARYQASTGQRTKP
jgi:uncharacterized protein YjbJ (UPF0337 family)